MSATIEKIEEYTLPAIALRGIVAFPLITVNFDLNDPADLRAVEVARQNGNHIFLTAFTEVAAAQKQAGNVPFHRIGTVVKIKQQIRKPEGGLRIVAIGVSRASVLRYRKSEDQHVMADLLCKTVTLSSGRGPRVEAYLQEILRLLDKTSRLTHNESEKLINAIKRIDDLSLLCDAIAANLIINKDDRLAVLECYDPLRRAEVLLDILDADIAVLEEGKILHHRVNARINRHQREFYLREQIKILQEELGETNDVDEFAERIEAAKLPREVEEKLLKENERLSKVPFGSAEATVIANYIDVCLDIPWTESTRDRVSFSAVQRVLDADHYGLEKVKERIVEYIAVKQLNPELRNQILCLVGPPGVGKTSVAASIARAMNRKYVRISLGGVRDEADIRGHRKTYIGAMPGRIVTALTQAKVRNPLILLDEIDKMSRDAHGDPTSAMLEVLDGEQNKAFRDHFVELPYDLSDCMFIATANSLENIPRPLMDRMEIIELGIYTKREKLAIAKEHLVAKQLTRHGLTKRTLRITDDALIEMIDFYTREAGVRNLERTIAAVCRKAGKRLLEEKRKQITVSAANLSEYLGARKLLPESIDEYNEVGVVNGLAYTELGGSLLKVEVAILEGSGKIETTGSLGDVMKESASLAVSYVRSIAAEYGIPTDFYKTKDIHIHFPEGAIPKDGPSAGITMVTALVSALSGRAVRRDLAMTGEISLRGRVLAIGGLKEKTMAAYNAGVGTVLIPEDNRRDIDELDALARDNLQILPCRTAKEVLELALLPQDAAIAENSAASEIGEEMQESVAACVPVTQPAIRVNAQCSHINTKTRCL